MRTWLCAYVCGHAVMCLCKHSSLCMRAEECLYNWIFAFYVVIRGLTAIVTNFQSNKLGWAVCDDVSGSSNIIPAKLYMCIHRNVCYWDCGPLKQNVQLYIHAIVLICINEKSHGNVLNFRQNACFHMSVCA